MFGCFQTQDWDDASYYILVFDENKDVVGVSNESSENIVIGNEEVSISNELELYPNPTSGVINLPFSNGILKVYSIKAEFIKSTNLLSQTVDLHCVNYFFV